MTTMTRRRATRVFIAGPCSPRRNSGPAIVPGRPDESLLIEAINHRSLQMPPEDEGGQMPADEIDILTRWVAMGAPDPRSGDDAIGEMTGDEARAWWAFQPLPAGPPLQPKPAFGF